MNIEPVAFFRSPLKEKFGVPRQAGLVPVLKGEVRFVAPYDSPEAVRGLEEFDYVWLVWGFSLNGVQEFSPTVRPPRLGGNKRVGVFASRSPFRPNGLGLSCVKLESIEKGVLKVSGADLVDGTPIYDVKPYIEYADSRTEIRSGFVDYSTWPTLEVEIPDKVLQLLGHDTAGVLSSLLSHDPRPHYQDDPERVYGLCFGSYNVKFRAEGKKVFVLSAESITFASNAEFDT
ncbi:MAG: tRNA (N6-threonylcarbamoyladenosine(37)-N6)-methyltransferase TrmO [Bacteroidales bacterium]|nr:tRNA (N6-threonylcarbamoyladenosine(37)-N6)-methyltransferase TrmO [Bacteroidales bacterium]